MLHFFLSVFHIFINMHYFVHKQYNLPIENSDVENDIGNDIGNVIVSDIVNVVVSDIINDVGFWDYIRYRLRPFFLY